MEEENVLINEEIIKVPESTAKETENRAHRIKREVTDGISLETEINLKLDLLLMTIRILNNRVIDLEKKLLKPKEVPDITVLKAHNKDKTSIGPETNATAKTGDVTCPEKGSGDIKQDPVDPEIFNVERAFLKPSEQPTKQSIYENIWVFL